MKKLLLPCLFVLFTSLPVFSQISFNSILNSFDGFENGNFKQHLEDNSFTLERTNSRATIETWIAKPNPDNADEGITIEKKTFPWNSLWIVFDRHPLYYEIQYEVIKNCDHTGFFGCSEVETWDAYKHISGIEFRLIELPDSQETGVYVIEVIEK
jgi:hypothetical protein